MDAAARELGLDPAEFRRRNFIGAAADAVQDRGRRDLRFGRVRARSWTRRSRRPTGRLRRSAGPRPARRGRRRGIGMATTSNRPWATRRRPRAIEFADDGMVNVVVGTQSNGQGHETAYAQVLNDRLGVPFEKIRVVQGDTAKLKWAAAPAARAR